MHYVIKVTTSTPWISSLPKTKYKHEVGEYKYLHWVYIVSKIKLTINDIHHINLHFIKLHKSCFQSQPYRCFFFRWWDLFRWWNLYTYRVTPLIGREGSKENESEFVWLDWFLNPPFVLSIQTSINKNPWNLHIVWKAPPCTLWICVYILVYSNILY